MQFIRQLRGFSGPIAAVAINNKTGDIVTCAVNQVPLYSELPLSESGADPLLDGQWRAAWP